ncbi:hypothetical protein QVD17_02532 [Tagetes erecta]|uniref:Uncharacterized protein n=1 Tax=Tagetes erecta TaxID=13708 RepID=A0AAD8LFT4_TARER|nr:hypothetical protein QVD17_02532 [Tagetes erecta]
MHMRTRANSRRLAGNALATRSLGSPMDKQNKRMKKVDKTYSYENNKFIYRRRKFKKWTKTPPQHFTPIMFPFISKSKPSIKLHHHHLAADHRRHLRHFIFFNLITKSQNR